MPSREGTHLPLHQYVIRSLLLSLWGLPLVSMLIAIVVFAISVTIDYHFASVTMESFGWPINFSGGTVLESASAISGIVAALLTLFFSITLIVLTIAAGNLGVRLIDRWVNGEPIRNTISILTGVLVFGVLLTMLSKSEPADGEPVLRFTLLVLFCGLLMSLGWLAFAFHHLSRAILVDTSIAKIGEDLASALNDRRHENNNPPKRFGEIENGCVFESDRDGYFESIDVEKIVNAASAKDLQVDVLIHLGEFVTQGQPIVTFSQADDVESFKKILNRSLTIASNRSDQQGAHFRADLLVEIAVRALSPAINDVYTAISCIDYLGAAIIQAAQNEFRDGTFADDNNIARLQMKGLRWIDAVHRPLQILRQSAASYPAPTLELMKMYRVAYERSVESEGKRYIAEQANRLLTSAMSSIDLKSDRDDIKESACWIPD